VFRREQRRKGDSVGILSIGGAGGVRCHGDTTGTARDGEERVEKSGSTVPFRSIRKCMGLFNFPTNPQNPPKSKENYWRGFQKAAVTREIRIE
jgi:hypothetical protein